MCQRSSLRRMTRPAHPGADSDQGRLPARRRHHVTRVGYPWPGALHPRWCTAATPTTVQAAMVPATATATVAHVRNGDQPPSAAPTGTRQIGVNHANRPAAIRPGPSYGEFWLGASPNYPRSRRRAVPGDGKCVKTREPSGRTANREPSGRTGREPPGRTGGDRRPRPGGDGTTSVLNGAGQPRRNVRGHRTSRRDGRPPGDDRGPLLCQWASRPAPAELTNLARGAGAGRQPTPDTAVAGDRGRQRRAGAREPDYSRISTPRANQCGRIYAGPPMHTAVHQRVGAAARGQTRGQTRDQDRQPGGTPVPM